MSLSIEPKHGIRLQLTSYSPIRSWQGGGKFWEHDHQLTIRQGKLAGFLPRVLEEDDSIRYEQIIDNREAASESVSLARMEEVPAGQIEALRAALHELKAKADDPLCDDTKRRIIEAFRLPDPVKDPELYRLYGKGPDRRLLVLWGVEKEAGSALVPLQALASAPLQARTSVGKSASSLWLWVLLAVLLLATLLWWMFHKSDQPEVAFDSQPGQNASVPGPAPGATTRPSIPPPLASTQPANAPAGVVPEAGGTVVPGANSTSPRIPDRSSAPVTEPDATAASSGGGTKTLNPDASPDDPAASRSSTDTASTTPGQPAQPARSGLSSPASSRTGSSPALAPSAEKDRLQAPSQPDARASSAGSSPSETSTSTPAVTPAESVTPPVSRITSLEIVSARSGTAPKNGRVEVLFNVLAHDAEGLSPDVPRIVAWTIDGEAQKGKDGKPIVNAALPVALTKGTHRVSLSATTPDGRPLKAQADVDIDVKVTEESSVKVRSTGQ